MRHKPESSRTNKIYTKDFRRFYDSPNGINEKKGRFEQLDNQQLKDLISKKERMIDILVSDKEQYDLALQRLRGSEYYKFENKLNADVLIDAEERLGNKTIEMDDDIDDLNAEITEYETELKRRMQKQ